MFQLKNPEMKIMAQKPVSASEEEAAAITAAIKLYLLKEAEAAKAQNKAPKARASNWLALRTRADATKRSWALRSFSLLLLGLLSVTSSSARAQSAAKLKEPAASANLNTLLGSPGPTVRVLLGQSLASFNLDCPDGAALYSLEANLPPVKVAQIPPQGSFTLSLTASAKEQGQLSFKPNNQQSKLNLAGEIARVGFFPAAALPTAVPKLTALPWMSEQAQGASSAYLLVPGSSERTIPLGQSLAVTQAAPLFAVNDKLYRGALLLKPQLLKAPASSGLAASLSSTLFSLINVLSVEDYLLSVVPSEVPSKWHSEALKAQAIAARSYALANLNKHGSEGYDLKATVEDQVYRGVISETEETNAAVQGTEGVVIKHDNKVVSAFFHSTSGGVTEVPENVWGKPLPYLKVVPDYDDASPQFNWTKKLTLKDVTRLLDPKFELNQERLLGLFVISRYSSQGQRVKDVLLVGEKSSRILSGGELRKAFNLPSTAFSIFQSEGGYSIAGRGYGHGLGLSQWGAKALAERGYNASQILSYYYKDISIEPNQDFSL